MKQLEHNEQVNLIKWWGLVCHQYNLDEKLLFAIPNGGQRNIITAKKLKNEGVRAGIPDLFLAVARGGFHGLFIEMKKADGGRLSKDQKSVSESLTAQGFAWALCHGWEDAKKCIERYLKDLSPCNF